MNVEDNINDEQINEIFKYWSLEEMKLYYRLMLQKKMDDENNTTEDDMWQLSTYNLIFEEFQDILRQPRTMEDMHQQMKKLRLKEYNKKKKMKQFRGYSNCLSFHLSHLMLISLM